MSDIEREEMTRELNDQEDRINELERKVIVCTDALIDAQNLEQRLRMKITALEDQIEVQRPKYPKIETFSLDIDYTQPLYNQALVNEW